MGPVYVVGGIVSPDVIASVMNLKGVPKCYLASYSQTIDIKPRPGFNNVELLEFRELASLVLVSSGNGPTRSMTSVALADLSNNNV